MRESSTRVGDRGRGSGKGRKVTSLKANTTLIRKTVGAGLSGPMDKYTKDSSRMTFGMERGRIGIRAGRWASLCGRRGR